MKKIIMFCSLALLTVGSMKAQDRGTVSPFVNLGYNFDETIPYDYSDMKIAGGFQWGVGAEFFVNRNISVELKYNRMDSEILLDNLTYNNKVDVLKASETFAAVGMAVADAFINCWKTKYFYHVERPFNFIYYKCKNFELYVCFL